MPQVKTISEADQLKILGTVRNSFNAAEGSLLPPPQQGQFRVPFVTTLKVYSSSTFVGGTQFILTFQEPNATVAQIDHYNIFVGGLTGNISQLTSPTTVKGSPAVVRVTTSAAQNVVFTVQTVLKNGLVSDLNASPKCTGTTIAATVNTTDIPNGSITLAQLAAGTAGALFVYDGSGNPSSLSDVAAGSYLISNGVSSPPTYQTFNFTRNLFIQTADATVGNTNTETSIVGTGTGSVTLAANFLTTGRTLRLVMRGYHSATGGPTINVKVKLGSTIILTTTAVTDNNNTNQGFELNADITCRSTGVSGTVAAQGSFMEEGSTSFQMVNTVPVTIDTTSSQLLDITITWGTGAPGNTITSTNFTLQTLS